MKIIQTNGLGNLTELEYSGGWYWCCDYARGDLYEAEELFRSGHPVQQNRLVFVHCPDSRVVEPIRAGAGQYFGAPAFENGKLQILMVDFPQAAIRIFQHDPRSGQTALRAELALAQVEDCYNLMLKHEPLMLTRQGADHLFQVLWPEKTAFFVGDTEAFCSREGEKLYFSRWIEDPDYRDEVVIRRFPTGEILEVVPGTLWEMPDGQRWVLQ